MIGRFLCGQLQEKDSLNLIGRLLALGVADQVVIADGGNPARLGVEGEVATSADASSDALPVTDTPPEGVRWEVTDIICSSDTDLTLSFVGSETGNIYFVTYIGAGSTFNIVTKSPFLLAVDEVLNVEASGAGNISVTALYRPA